MSNNFGYKGDVTPCEAYKILTSNSAAVMIDVRTSAEWQFVGVPEVNNLYFISWQLFPSGEVNNSFIIEVKEIGIANEVPLLFLCRSGARSMSAANELANIGYTNCYNISEGFEGDKDADGHRGNIGGWKYAGLPWVQN